MKWFLLVVATILSALACYQQQAQAQVIVYQEPVQAGTCVCNGSAGCFCDAYEGCGCGRNPATGQQMRRTVQATQVVHRGGNRYVCNGNSCRLASSPTAALKAVVVSEYRETRYNAPVARSVGPVRGLGSRFRLRGRVGCGG